MTTSGTAPAAAAAAAASGFGASSYRRSSLLPLSLLLLVASHCLVRHAGSFTITPGSSSSNNHRLATTATSSSSSSPFPGAAARNHRVSSITSSLLALSSSTPPSNDEDENEDDADRELFSSLDDGGASPDDPALDWTVPKSKDDGAGEIKLGIDIGKQLAPLTDEEAAELKAAATEVINDAIAEGIDEIAKLREKMTKELAKKRKEMQFASELNAERESERLLSKIDRMTDDFLKDTQLSRSATRLAAAADRSSEGGGVEVGVWGNLGGAAVTTAAAAAGAAPSSLLGSVEAARASAGKSGGGAGTGSQEADDASSTATATTSPPRIVVVADMKQDPYAKKLVPRLTEVLEEAVPGGLVVDVYPPTATLPLGGNNANCALLFATSLSDKASVANSLDRLLRKTLQTGGKVGQPPTQIVLVSTVGTERTDKVPYSVQNLLGGGKLDKRRQMEETVLLAVRERVAEPPLDFTICKLGSELKDSKSVKEPFALMPGDCLDGSTDVDTAATILKEAIAFQPSARNATLCCVGKMESDTTTTTAPQDALDDWFLRLDGPELWRHTLSEGDAEDFDVLVEYLSGWADILSDGKKGLTTPVRTEPLLPPRRLPTGVERQEGVRLLFLPTATGKNYLSRDEEKKLNAEGKGKTSNKVQRSMASLLKKEGGIEVVIEVLADAGGGGGSLRVRAKRCNYVADAVVKELSEETILKRLEESLDAWTKDHK